VHKFYSAHLNRGTSIRRRSITQLTESIPPPGPDRPIVLEAKTVDVSPGNNSYIGKVADLNGG
jgi:hypothetical protein